MFEEALPAELREAIVRCGEWRLGLECGLGWAEAYGVVPVALGDRARAHLERTRQVPLDVTRLYRRRDISLGEAIYRLECVCDLSDLLPGVERPRFGSSLPRDP